MNNDMKRLVICILALAATLFEANAQTDAQKAAAEAAAAIAATPETVAKAPKPKYWKTSLMTNLNFIQSTYCEWSKGGFDNYAASLYMDAIGNYQKKNFYWNNRLQIDYGMMYSKDKPIVQKNKDRFLLESTAGNRVSKAFSYTAKFTLLSQFANGYNYPTPTKKEGEKLSKKQWRDARVLKSGLFSPATVNVGIGLELRAGAWLTVNFAPVTGGFTIVSDEMLRKNYGMKRKKDYKDLEEYPDTFDEKGNMTSGSFYHPAKFEFGAQMTIDAKVRVNTNFDASTHVLLFSNYLENPQNIRVNWDTRFMWKVAKFFSLNLTTSLVYDDKVRIVNEDHPAGHRAVQFYEALQFGFTYTFASKK